MKDKDLAERMTEILSKYYIWYDAEQILEIAKEHKDIEFTTKASGDSYSRLLAEVFSKNDLRELKDIAKQLKLQLPDEVWYD